MKKDNEKNEEKPKKGLWKKVGEGFLEIFGELIIILIAFAAGMGILTLLGQKDLVEQWDPELVSLVGILAILAVTGIVIAIVAIVKKKKK